MRTGLYNKHTEIKEVKKMSDTLLKLANQIKQLPDVDVEQATAVAAAMMSGYELGRLSAQKEKASA